ncbi:unnamed protein product [Ectocarpus sp. CCAP 1310/34]|nr:unnamed protein product [Ectocarpus sp. CCAP 1310/34]
MRSKYSMRIIRDWCGVVSPPVLGLGDSTESSRNSSATGESLELASALLTRPCSRACSSASNVASLSASAASIALSSYFRAARVASASAQAASLFSTNSSLRTAIALLATAALAPLTVLGGRPIGPPVATRLPRLVLAACPSS